MLIDILSTKTVFSPKTVYYFDANVWVYIDSPSSSASNPVKSSAFASALSNILITKECQIVISPILISEYINTRLRQYYSAYIKKSGISQATYTFKQYRNDASSDYNKILSSVLNDIQKILTISTIVPDISDKTDTNNILSDSKLLNLDTNDSYISTLCKKNNYILITDDADFDQTTLNIISTNKKYLSK